MVLGAKRTGEQIAFQFTFQHPTAAATTQYQS
jgi:hypothetical protein